MNEMDLAFYLLLALGVACFVAGCLWDLLRDCRSQLKYTAEENKALLKINKRLEDQIDYMEHTRRATMSELRTHEDVERDVLKRVRHQVKLARDQIGEEIIKEFRGSGAYQEHWRFITRRVVNKYKAEILRRLDKMEEGK